MLSIFDSFVTIAPDSYALTLIVNNTPARAVLVVERIDNENRCIQLTEFIPNNTHGVLLNDFVVYDYDKSAEEIDELIKKHNADIVPNPICPQIYPVSFSSTYNITSEQAKQLFINCHVDNLTKYSDAYSYAAQHLTNIGIIPPTPTIGEDPGCEIKTSYHFTLKALSTIALVAGFAILAAGILAIILSGVTAISVATVVIGGVAALSGGIGLGFFSKSKPTESVNNELDLAMTPH